MDDTDLAWIGTQNAYSNELILFTFVTFNSFGTAFVRHDGCATGRFPDADVRQEENAHLPVCSVHHRLPADGFNLFR